VIQSILAARGKQSLSALTCGKLTRSLPWSNARVMSWVRSIFWSTMRARLSSAKPSSNY